VALRGTLTLPATKGPHPVVVLLHGSGPARRPFGMWQYFLARHGIATLTYDKRGAGASTGDWQTASFEDLTADALAAVQFLRNRPHINPREIGLWGNSNSGWVVGRFGMAKKDARYAAANDPLVQPNNSLDRSGGRAFRIKPDAAKVGWIRAARSTQSLARFLMWRMCDG
jgi:alpha-beta hydrolase superfamily lysophospholipase